MFDPEPEPERETKPVAEPLAAEGGRRKITRSSQHTERRAGTLEQEVQLRRLKQEGEASSHVKREHNNQEDGPENSDGLSIVETRSYKRPRADQEVIVLD